MELVKELLFPHFGHYNFLSSILKKDNIDDKDNIVNLVELIKDKSLIQHLPKPLHNYTNYYGLIVNLTWTKNNLKLIRWIKQKLTPQNREIFLSIIKIEEFKSGFEKIITDPELTATFLKFSSRIKTIEAAKTYITDVLNNKSILDNLKQTGNTVIKLTNWETDNRQLPSSWCIKNRDTFNRYLSQYDIYICLMDNKIWGINVNREGIIISILDQNNGQVPPGTVYDFLKSEIIAMNIFKK